MKKSATSLFAGGMLLVALGGCAKSPPSAADPSLTTENSASVVVYRPRTLFHRGNPELPFVFLNGQQAGKLAINSALEIRVPAGEHTFSMKEPILFMPAHESGHVTLKAEAGKTYFLRYSREAGGVIPVPGALHVIPVTGFDLVPEEVGKQRQ